MIMKGGKAAQLYLQEVEQTIVRAREVSDLAPYALHRQEPLEEEEELFYQGKYQTLVYFFHYELPKIEGLARRLMEGDGLTVEWTWEPG
jgi:hypothetical protein